MTDSDRLAALKAGLMQLRDDALNDAQRQGSYYTCVNVARELQKLIDHYEEFLVEE